MSLKRQTLWSMAPLVVITALNLVSVPLFYRYLGAEMYALWFYVQTLSGSFGFMDLGLGTAVGRYLGVALGNGDRAAGKEYWGTGNASAIPLLLLMASVFALLGIWLGPRWFNVAAANVRLLRLCFALGGVSIFLAYYNLLWNILSQAQLDFKFLSLVRIGITVLGIVPSLILAKLTGNPVILILWSIAVAVVQLAVFIIHARVSYDLGFEFRHSSLARLREMGSYIAKSFFTILINSLFGSIDRLIAGKLAPPQGFASYTIASNLGGRLSAFSMAAAAPVFNNTSRSGSDAEAPARIYDEAFSFLIGWYALAVAWIAVWHQPAAQLWLGTVAGSRVSPLLAPLTLAYALTAISIISSSQLGALNKVGTQAIYHLASGILTVPAVFVGWKVGGLEGLAWGFLASRATLLLQDIYLLRLIGAGGWLSSSTWLHLLLQGGLAAIFLVLRRLEAASLPMQVALAGIHALLVAMWLLRAPARDMLSQFKSPPAVSSGK